MSDQNQNEQNDQNSNMNPSVDGDDETGAMPTSEAAIPGVEADAEREALLKERRNRQMGKSKKGRNRKLTGYTILACTVAGVGVLAVGPSGLANLFGGNGDGKEQRTSQVNLDVERDRNSAGGTNLDFVVPGPMEVVEKDDEVDRTAPLNQRIAELEKSLTDLRNKPSSDVSLGEVQRLLNENNTKMQAQLEEERRRMAEENAKLRDDAARREEEARLREEEYRLRQEELAKAQQIEDQKRQSPSVVLDGSDVAGGAPGSVINAPQERTLSGNELFLASSASDEFETAQSKPIADPSRTVVQGTIISGVLETAINTELPGNIRAQVTEPVFSYDGNLILMPAGTVLIGTFNPEIDVAQKRVLIAWNRAITPDGQSIALGSTGADVLGRSGTRGNVDNRYLQKFGAAALISTITALPTAVAALASRGQSSGTQPTSVSVGGETGTTVTIAQQDQNSGSAAAEIGSNASQQLSDQSQGVLEEYLSLPPIIRIPQGEEIRIFVNRDLVFR